MDHKSSGSFQLDQGFPNFTSDIGCVSLGVTLLLYVVAATKVVSLTLVIERAHEGHVLKAQSLVYFVNGELTKSKARYPHI